MAQKMNAMSIKTMAEIIEHVEAEGYIVVSGKVLEDGGDYKYAFYAITENRLTGEMVDSWFKASLKRVGGYMFKPLCDFEVDEYYAD